MLHIAGSILTYVLFVYVYALMQACVILKAVTNLGTDSYFVAAMAWVVLIVVLGFLVHVLDNVIDTIYVCYAIDRELELSVSMLCILLNVSSILLNVIESAILLNVSV